MADHEHTFLPCVCHTEHDACHADVCPAQFHVDQMVTWNMKPEMSLGYTVPVPAQVVGYAERDGGIVAIRALHQDGTWVSRTALTRELVA